MEFSEINARFKQIQGFEDYYITEDGCVYSTRLRGREKEPHLHKIKAKNPGKDNRYLNVILCSDERQATKYIHRLVAESFVDGYFDGAVVNHIDGNNRNNHASNLEWTTTRDNVLKSYKTSGMSAKRNYKEWKLYDPSGELVGIFYNHKNMQSFVTKNGINASPTQLTKKGNSRGYYIIKRKMQPETVTTIHKEYIAVENPAVEVPASA